MQGEAEDKEAEEQVDEQKERKVRRKRLFDMLLGAAISLLALWLIGGFFVRPGPWVELAQRLELKGRAAVQNLDAVRQSSNSSGEGSGTA